MVANKGEDGKKGLIPWDMKNGDLEAPAQTFGDGDW